MSRLRKGRLDQRTGHQVHVRHIVLGEGREGAALQPVLGGGALAHVPSVMHATPACEQHVC